MEEKKRKKKQKSKIDKQLKRANVNNNNNDNNDYKEDLHDDNNVVDRNKKIKFANFDFEQKKPKRQINKVIYTC